MDEYRLKAKTMVVHRKWYYNSEKKRLSIDIHHDEINITIRSNKEVIIDLGDCTVGEDLIRYLKKTTQILGILIFISFPLELC